ncbi:DUF1254 domain-containing protein [Pseudoxanthomonas indica]|uniref:Uncharacterized conserved protein n=1 Tax=Pseudoxanthomonas indica TaxID=428993 RepID=A0A1T5LWI3_9GAMM|nr:DUF1254 domain-containing protein [Pseudoxanthomonas indica]GGD40945.1 membrane protein [Pseudoxanthomonas indica]SKC80245.1 Uncharacterized conserved protein [Pseudoxanthomonas indica]
MSILRSATLIAVMGLVASGCQREQAAAPDAAVQAPTAKSSPVTPATPVVSTLASMDPAKASALLRDAYVYAYPLILMDVTQRQATNVPNATSVPMRAPLNQFAHFRTYPDASARDVVRFNFDTLYSFAWLDLGQGPVVLSVPDTGGRFYLVPTLDMWTDVFSSLGSRTTGTKAGHFAYVPPGWSGSLPAGVERIDAPTSMIWLMERTQTNGPSDYDNVHKVQDQLKLTPLSQWGKDYAPPASVPTDESVDNKTPPLVTVQSMSGVDFFTRFAALLKKYPPHGTDYPMLFRLRALGIAPGQDWNAGALDDKTTALINEAAKAAQAEITAEISRGSGATHVNGWNYATDNMGTYGTSYLRRAMVALGGLGANLPEDAVYPLVFADSEGKPLQGSTRYVLHFAKDQLPPADAFWSLTMYDAQGFQVPNPINRFAIGDRDALQFNGDGSLDLYLQPQSPGAGKESNWLPSPASGVIQPTLRLYSPRAEVMTGRWVPPALKRVNQ